MKYIRVTNSKDKENPISYYPVDDFDLETIRKLPFYKEPYDCFFLVEAEIDESDTINVSEFYKAVYYGKRITKNKVKELVGNNPKYATLLDALEEKYITPDKVELDQIGEEDFLQTDSLFVAPDMIFPNLFVKDGEISIEEFDPDIKLDYTQVFVDFKNNSIMAALYAAKYNMLLYCFSQFFRALQNVYYNIQDLNVLFELYKFDFIQLGYKDLKEIEHFLDLYGYFDSLDETGLFLLSQYKVYISEVLEEGLSR